MGRMVSYRSTRLHFKADVIELLAMSDTFEVVTPDATWRMTKAEFYRVFPNVIATQSYSGGRGEYHYPTTPAKAVEFRVP